MCFTKAGKRVGKGATFLPHTQTRHRYERNPFRGDHALTSAGLQGINTGGLSARQVWSGVCIELEGISTFTLPVEQHLRMQYARAGGHDFARLVVVEQAQGLASGISRGLDATPGYIAQISRRAA